MNELKSILIIFLTIIFWFLFICLAFHLLAFFVIIFLGSDYMSLEIRIRGLFDYENVIYSGVIGIFGLGQDTHGISLVIMFIGIIFFFKLSHRISKKIVNKLIKE